MAELFEAVLELAEDHLVLGHRLSEWCGHAPMLEEDLALPNMALDLIGTARSLYTYAGKVEGAGRGEDDLAYLRDERGFRNCLLVERANGDFARTMLRQFYFATLMEPYWQAACLSGDEVLRGIAGKAVKEATYFAKAGSGFRRGLVSMCGCPRFCK
ncbi:MAG: 1,2-phenylacetyl-CoA epoxidase subunit PaaC, partial [Halocynthiibacter sp.]